LGASGMVSWCSPKRLRARVAGLGVPFLADKSEDHRRAQRKGVKPWPRTAAAAARDEIALQHEHPGTLERRTGWRDQLHRCRSAITIASYSANGHRCAEAIKATIGKLRASQAEPSRSVGAAAEILQKPGRLALPRSVHQHVERGTWGRHSGLLGAHWTVCNWPLAAAEGLAQIKVFTR